MRDSNEKQDGIFYPQEIEEMAEELKRRQTPSGTKEDREDMAAEIVRCKQREHEQADRECPHKPAAPRPPLP